ncbi:winged helix-turn-helix transcriptional regulator [Sphingobacterium thalpophilum]|uniref:winged helix-turn-helix transcriptional regulator n=1 Tax=Sphingobacterium thalpophilum TaxID=259 RepID=UPI0037D99481
MAHSVINSLCNGSRRFREIERSIPGITTRMLSKELKDMELNKLLVRKVYPDIPVLIEYEPTEYCRTFGKIIQEMINWGREHRKKVIEDQ